MGSLWRDDEDHDCSRLSTQYQGAIDVREAFIDATFAPAKKRGHRVGKMKRGKGTKIMASKIATGCQFLFAPRVPLPMK